MIEGSTSLTNFDYANFWKNESDSMASNIISPRFRHKKEKIPNLC